MNKSNVYLYYSGATDLTGKALVEALGITGGTTSPKGHKELVIGWGTKIKDPVTLNATKVLNHPNYIKSNRNKLATLGILKKAGVSVADFVETEGVAKKLVSKSGFTFPLIGRTKYHQGGDGFWTVLDNIMLKEAVKEGAEYFQKRIAIADEFRLHIFNGKLIYAQKKVKRDDTAKAFKEQQASKLANAAERGKVKLDKATQDLILNRMAEEQSPHADMLIRSNTRGWKFSQIKESSVKTDLLTEATNALTAIKLDFGAVDCCLDEEGRPWIIEINSGPGLDGTPFDIYVATFNKIMEEKKPEATKVEKTTVAKDTAVKTSGKASRVEKLTLKQKLELLAEMADEAEDDEEEALGKIAKRMFGGKG